MVLRLLLAVDVAKVGLDAYFWYAVHGIGEVQANGLAAHLERSCIRESICFRIRIWRVFISTSKVVWLA